MIFERFLRVGNLKGIEMTFWVVLAGKEETKEQHSVGRDV